MSIEVMTPELALARQIERYRQMSGEQRLQIALNLHALSCQIARDGIRSQFPTADEEEIDRRLRERIALSRQ